MRLRGLSDVKTREDLEILIAVAGLRRPKTRPESAPTAVQTAHKKQYGLEDGRAFSQIPSALHDIAPVREDF